MDKAHQKHAKLTRPGGGAWGRVELALLGAPCSLIRELSADVAARLRSKWKIALVDEAHQSDNAEEVIHHVPAIQVTNHSDSVQISLPGSLRPAQQRTLLSDADVVLLNGNHFTSTQQILLITAEKPTEHKLDRLTDVRLVLTADDSARIPEYLHPYIGAAPVMAMADAGAIAAFLDQYLSALVAPLNGLVLTGGKSERMGKDKSLLEYHGKPQRDYMYDVLTPVCREVYVSCNSAQGAEIMLPKIEDRFLGIGPMGGLLSAFQTSPDAAWLTVACDMPYLSRTSLDYLVAHRNPSKLATAFISPDEAFPEPLITIWEPKAYPVLLQALGQGISCPRKVLINSDVQLLQSPDKRELHNVNDPASFTRAMVNFKTPAPKR